jgi:UDP-hydrolysing UDP-N-acetyl-D-glucosamine 2-epimerase
MSKRICVVTGSRAEYGVMYWLLHDLRADPEIDLQLIVTGMHLAPEFGLTVREIEKDGFPISRQVEMLLSSDSSAGIAKSIGLGVIGMSDAFEHLKPDFVLVLGDRFEILAAAQASLIHNIPLIHLAGGDTTEGAFDESIRHAITKMAHVHFVTNEESAQRVRQMGEDPQYIHMVGSLGLDHLRRTTLLNGVALEAVLDAKLGTRNLLITFHPVTLESGRAEEQFEELLAALDNLDHDVTLWFTRPNADTGGRSMSIALDQWAATRSDRVHVFASLGQLRYLSLMAQVDAVVGNSSSGLYEAPSFKVPTVDIGDRQRGRLAAPSVVHCAPTKASIALAIDKALAMDCIDVVNPYGDGETAGRIVKILHSLPRAPVLLKKHFHMVESTLT